MDRIALYSFMVRHRFGVVSSISGDGTPQSALVGIPITPQLEIVFDTVRSSRKYPKPDCSARLLLCRGMGRRADGGV
jgi:hypothetical protein